MQQEKTRNIYLSFQNYNALDKMVKWMSPMIKKIVRETLFWSQKELGCNFSKWFTTYRGFSTNLIDVYTEKLLQKYKSTIICLQNSLNFKACPVLVCVCVPI